MAKWIPAFAGMTVWGEIAGLSHIQAPTKPSFLPQPRHSRVGGNPSGLADYQKSALQIPAHFQLGNRAQMHFIRAVG